MMRDQCKRSFSDNAFDVIRLYAAVQVMLGHATQHLGVDLPQWLAWGFKTPGVIILFTICGFLITASADRASQADKEGYRKYFRKRFCRIFPGFWVSVLVSSIVIAIVYTTRPTIKQAIIYVLTQFTTLNFYTGEWLRDYGVGAPNGSLWTIIIELQFYVVIVLIWRVLKKKGLPQWLVFLAGALAINIATGYAGIKWEDNILFKLYCQTFLPYLYYFGIGAFAYRYRERLYKLRTWAYVTAIVVLISISILFGNAIPGHYVAVVRGTCIAVVTILAAYVLGRRIRLPFDISYGTYLYHMIVINLLVELGFYGSVPMFALACLCSIALGFASWYLVEKRWIGK